jgi:hypothetical protein
MRGEELPPSWCEAAILARHGILTVSQSVRVTPGHHDHPHSRSNAGVKMQTANGQEITICYETPGGWNHATGTIQIVVNSNLVIVVK